MTTEPPKPEDDTVPDADGDSESAELSLAELSEAYASVLKQNEQPPDGEVEKIAADDVATFSKDDPADDGESTPEETTRKELTMEQRDAADNAACPVSPKSIIESLLFVGTPAGEKLTAKKIAAVMRDVGPKEVKQTIADLNQGYEQHNAAFRIVEEGGHLKMQLCDDLREVQDFFFGRNKAAKLSQGAIDVLAVVAYHQPVSKSRIEKIRTRPSGGVLGQLLRRNLISVFENDQPRKEKQYQTTDRFLKLFGLESLEDLPQTSVVSDLEELTDY